MLSVRNAEIRRRARLGERVQALATEFGVSRQRVNELKLWDPPLPKAPKPPLPKAPKPPLPKAPKPPKTRAYYGQFICSAGGHPTNETLTRYAPRKYACPECLPGVTDA